jgi:mono/diheme cytochrome c family protein
MMGDPSASVRRQLAASLGELAPKARIDALASVLQRDGADPIAVDAALSGVRDDGLALIDRIAEGGEETANRRTALTMAAALVVRAGEERSVQGLFAFIGADGRAGWQRSAVVDGAAVALLGAAMPGTARRGGGAPAADAPCNTCPGGRAGPGGAPAFPAPAAATTPAGGGRGGAGPRLRLDTKPAIADITISDEGLRDQVTRVLARVDWPGKAGGAQQPAPLSAADQARFDEGKDVYENLCQACHQPDGRGLENAAPSLIGSDIVVGPADIAARVLLHGKEGTVGLMPPLGAMLTDQQIAAALTFIRRSWGHTASPVDPAAVRKTRDANTGRTRPWTSQELAKLR